MLTDAASLGLALFAMRLAARPATGRWTYGLRRAEILSAQANGITLLVLVVVFTYEAARRLVEPPAVSPGVDWSPSPRSSASRVNAAGRAADQPGEPD